MRTSITFVVPPPFFGSTPFLLRRPAQLLRSRPSYHPVQRRNEGTYRQKRFYIWNVAGKYKRKADKPLELTPRRRPSVSVASVRSSPLQGLLARLSSPKGGIKWKLPSISIAELFLPVGYPDTVPTGYKSFAKWNALRTVCGWTLHVLTTQTMLFAVGIGAKEGLALSATWNWVLKDGCGMISKIFFGSRFARSFDEETKRWRVACDAIMCIGAGIEIITPMYPSQFLILASIGYGLKATADAATGAAYRVFLNSFAEDSSNIGDVSAKAESQIVAANVIGLILGVSLSSKVGTDVTNIFAAYLVLSGLHVLATYYASYSVQMRTLNWQRLNAVLSSFVTTGTVPLVEDINANEKFWGGKPRLVPAALQLLSDPSIESVSLGVALQDLTDSEEERYVLSSIFEQERYVMRCSERAVQISLDERASPRDVVQALVQAHVMWQKDSSESEADDLRKSLATACKDMDMLWKQMEEKGWKVTAGMFFSEDGPRQLLQETE